LYIPIKMNRSEALEFQIINWYTNDIQVDSSDNDSDDEVQDNIKYIIKVFGVDESGRSISATFTGFTPHFYVKMNKRWTKSEIERFTSALRNKMGYRFQNTHIDAKTVQRKDFWGFTNNEDFWFLRLCFVSHRAMKSATYILNSNQFYVPGFAQKKFKMYESNIEPFLRFVHMKDIQPAGWIKIPANTYYPDDILPSKCPIDVKTKWTNVQSIDKEAIAPLLIASFDLECMSSDGDFPVAIKDYQKFAIDIYNMNNELSKKKEDTYVIKKKIIDSIEQQFQNNQVFSKASNMKDILIPTLNREMDHILMIATGHSMIMRNAFREVFNSYFTKPTKSAQACIDFYNKISQDKITSSVLKKSMTTWMTKCFEQNYEIFDKKCGKDVEDIIEELIKLLFCEKDAILHVIANYLNDILPPLKGDEIIQIGTTFHRYGEQECNKKVLLSLGTCDKIEGIEVIECKTEGELVLKWAQLINESNPDVVTGYNIFGFDFQYIYDRAKELGVLNEFCKIGRLKDQISNFKVSKLSSSALGDNVMRYVDMEGRTLIDLMKVIQRDHKLDSYKLDNVANHFMKMNKNDVSPQDIFRLYKEDSKSRAIIADYCVQDCALCNKLIMKLEIIANNVGMANVCSVPMSWIFMRGQGVKIFSLVAKECKVQKFLVPTISKSYNNKDDTEEIPEEEGYEGATVLEPKTGIYIDTPISVLDYASLYPSSMISENLSHDCIVLDEKYNNLPGVEYLDVSYDLYEQDGDEKKKVGEKVCRFVQPPNNEKGIIPNILKHLLKQRKLTRKRMEYQRVTLKDGTQYTGLYKNGSGKVNDVVHEEVYTFDESEKDTVEDVFNSFQKAVLDGLQLAYKVTANSLYGQIGAKTSPIYLKDIAACTTATGRKMIMLAKDFVEKNYCAEVVYGDSVTGYTPTILRIKDEVRVEKIENLMKYGDNNWKQCIEAGKQEKEYCELTGVEVWTDDGWTLVERVIRHKLADHKKIIRVLTHTGVVDVTDDHSLLKPDKTEISPKDLKIGDTLLHHNLPLITERPSTISPDEARIMGMFMGDGSCGNYNCASGNKASWAINNSSMELLEKYKELLEQVYSHLSWKILDTLKSSGVYKLIPSGQQYGDVTRFVNMYRSLLYDGQNKIVPSTVLNSSQEVRQAFWDGFYDADGDKDKKMFARVDQKSQVSAQCLNLLASSLGHNVSVNTRMDKQEIYRLTVSNTTHRRNPNAIKKLHEVKYEGYVYDLTTSNHHFSCGVGKIIVHNTDSIFISFPKQLQTENGVLKDKEALQKSIDLGIEASTNIKPLLKAPHDLEWEKVLFPMILFSKKRYCANKYENDVNKFKQISMGIVLKRRDNANIVKIIYGGIIDIILNKHDIKASVSYLKESLQRLIEGKFPLEDLVITKTLKGRYKDPEKIAHKVLAERIKERSPGSAPQVNDRIPFVYIQVEQKSKEKILQGNRIEHPDYIREKKLKPDYEFYLTNQLMKPVLQIYALILEQLDGYKPPTPSYWKEVKANLQSEGLSERKIREKIADMKEVEVKKVLFDPILLQLKHMKTGQTQITNYFSRVG
jgi:DNA polymerase elongation subunit (family B)